MSSRTLPTRLPDSPIPRFTDQILVTRCLRNRFPALPDGVFTLTTWSVPSSLKIVSTVPPVWLQVALSDSLNSRT